MKNRRPDSFEDQASQRTSEEAQRITRSIQTPGQTKEQTRMIAQGIEKGIALYKQQLKQKVREQDKACKKALRLKVQAQEAAEGGGAEPSTPDGKGISVSVALTVSGLLFAVVSVLHLVRYLKGWQVVVADFSIPVAWSLPAALLAGFLAGWMLRAAWRVQTGHVGRMSS